LKNKTRQVHKAKLKSGMVVAVKVQYPGVRESISSDVKNVKKIIQYFNVFPKGAFIDFSVKQAEIELMEECNYLREASNQKKFIEVLKNHEMNKIFYVPKVVDELTTERVLVSEFVFGKSIEEIMHSNQKIKNFIGENMIKLCLNEIFIFKFMQVNIFNFF
jgi:aarF domain-containing kinase